MSDVAVVAAVLLATVGVVLIADVARVWRQDRSAIADAERIQVLTAVAAIVFGASFFLARAGSDSDSTEPAPPPAQIVAPGDLPSVSRLAAAARLPGLQGHSRGSEPARGRRPQRKPAQETSPPSPEQAPATTTSTSTTTAPPTTTTPAPPPEPAPNPDSTVPFDSRE